MADNVNITPGSGAVVATDQVPGTLEHVQLFKLAYSADGSRTLVPADINGLLVNPGTGAASLGKAEDSPHGSGDTGVMFLAVRKDSATALANADNDYIPLTTDSSGRVHVNVGAALAAQRTTDSVAVAHQTDAIMQGLTARTPGFGVIDVAASGDNTLLAAQGSGNKIRVYAAMLVAAGTVTVRFESGASGTALTGQMNLVANTGFVLPFNPLGWFETGANALLNLELSGAVSVDGCFTYSIVT